MRAIHDAILPARNYPYVVSLKKMVSFLQGNKILIDQACGVKAARCCLFSFFYFLPRSFYGTQLSLVPWKPLKITCPTSGHLHLTLGEQTHLWRRPMIPQFKFSLCTLLKGQPAIFRQVGETSKWTKGFTVRLLFRLFDLQRQQVLKWIFVFSRRNLTHKLLSW